MSVSSSRRYSLSASSTPARKAPSAIDRPSHCISVAMPTTSSSAAAVKISGVLLRAIQRSAGRSSRRPPRMTPPTIPMTLIASSDQLAPGSASTGSWNAVHQAAQQRQQGQDRDRGHVLEQQDRKARLPAGGAQQVALLHHLQRDGRGRQRQAQRRHHGRGPGHAQRHGHAAPARRRSPAPARCPSRRSAGAGSTGGAAPAPARPGTASAPRRTRQSAGCPRRC